MNRYRAVFWDVYGTLLAAPRGDLESLVRREAELRGAFEQTVRQFHLTMTAEQLHHRWLRALAEQRATKIAAGILHPEIRIEEVWQNLLPGFPAREVALYFERRANPKKLQPGARETLLAIQQRGLRQGIISNAQFYTLIELRERLGGDFFDPGLIFLSCHLGVAKPDRTAFRLAADALVAHHIAPTECLFVGDSLVNDIEPAREVGFCPVLIGPTGDIQRLPQLLERL